MSGRQENGFTVAVEMLVYKVAGESFFPGCLFIHSFFDISRISLNLVQTTVGLKWSKAKVAVTSFLPCECDQTHVKGNFSQTVQLDLAFGGQRARSLRP